MAALVIEEEKVVTEKKELYFGEAPKILEDYSCGTIVKYCPQTSCSHCPFDNANIHKTVNALVK